MRFKTNFRTIGFAGRIYENELDRFLTEEITEAAKSWLTTVLVIIPTWSRASRATFEALAAEVGFNVTYGPILSRKDRRSLGKSESDGGLEIRKFDSYKFFYETNLRYLAFNEANRATPGSPPRPFGELTHDTPYNFLDAGRRDFESRVEAIKLPSVRKFFRSQRI